MSLLQAISATDAYLLTLIFFFSITLSPVSVAALGLNSSSRGLSLRFPRFIKTREDKSPEQASTTNFLAQIWQDQQGRPKATAGEADDGDLVDVELDSEGAAGESDG